MDQREDQADKNLLPFPPPLTFFYDHRYCDTTLHDVPRGNSRAACFAFLIEQWRDKKTIITKILQLKIICSTCR